MFLSKVSVTVWCHFCMNRSRDQNYNVIFWFCDPGFQLTWTFHKKLLHRFHPPDHPRPMTYSVRQLSQPRTNKSSAVAESPHAKHSSTYRVVQKLISNFLRPMPACSIRSTIAIPILSVRPSVCLRVAQKNKVQARDQGTLSVCSFYQQYYSAKI